jgi:hypothetical protein
MFVFRRALLWRKQTSTLLRAPFLPEQRDKIDRQPNNQRKHDDEGIVQHKIYERFQIDGDAERAHVSPHNDFFAPSSESGQNRKNARPPQIVLFDLLFRESDSEWN